MSARDTAGDGLPGRSLFHRMTVAPPRRRTPFERAMLAVRDYAGMGAFAAMLIACAVLVVLSR